MGPLGSVSSLGRHREVARLIPCLPARPNTARWARKAVLSGHFAAKLTRILSPVLIIAALAGCELPTAGERAPELRVLRSQYPAGDTLRARLVNRTGERIIYGACSLSLEQETSGGWVIALPAPELCIAIGYAVSPGGTASLKLPLPRTLGPGRYRVRQRVLLKGAFPERFLQSAPFTMRGPG